MDYHDTNWDEYATETQWKYLNSIRNVGAKSTAEAYMVDVRTVYSSMKKLRERAALQGYSPESGMTVNIPSPYVVRGTSTLYNAEGDIKQQWVKTKLDDQHRTKLIYDAIEEALVAVPRLTPLKAPIATNSNLCNLYTFTDYHMGMLSWWKETGTDWNLEIAEKTLIGSFEQMIAMSPDAETCVINQLGDFLHFDSLAPVTPTSGHIVDSASNYSQMVNATIRTLRRIVDVALMKHKKVHFVVAEGNHDMASSVWLRQMFSALYENEPRITVNDSEVPYYVYQHGKTMLGFHHGHKKKKEALPLLFAARYAEIWGQTTKRYIHTGHYHHEEVKEHPGVKVIQHPTLAASDAYAARGGWMSERQASGITYHSEYGKVGEVIVTPEMLSL
jgi:hypothetical protein